jgi:hypothetical protein
VLLPPLLLSDPPPLLVLPFPLLLHVPLPFPPLLGVGAGGERLLEDSVVVVEVGVVVVVVAT